MEQWRRWARGAAALLGGLALATQVLVLATPPHWCFDQHAAALQEQLPLPPHVVKQFALPPEGGGYSACERFSGDLVGAYIGWVARGRPPFRSAADASIPCDQGWAFNHTALFPTITSQEQWVCGERWRPQLVHAAFWLGAAVGALLWPTLQTRRGGAAWLLGAQLAGDAATALLWRRYVPLLCARFVVGAAAWPLSLAAGGSGVAEAALGTAALGAAGVAALWVLSWKALLVACCVGDALALVVALCIALDCRRRMKRLLKGSSQDVQQPSDDALQPPPAPNENKENCLVSLVWVLCCASLQTLRGRAPAATTWTQGAAAEAAWMLGAPLLRGSVARWCLLRVATPTAAALALGAAYLQDAREVLSVLSRAAASAAFVSLLLQPHGGAVSDACAALAITTTPLLTLTGQSDERVSLLAVTVAGAVATVASLVAAPGWSEWLLRRCALAWSKFNAKFSKRSEGSSLPYSTLEDT